MTFKFKVKYKWSRQKCGLVIAVVGRSFSKLMTLNVDLDFSKVNRPSGMLNICAKFHENQISTFLETTFTRSQYQLQQQRS